MSKGLFLSGLVSIVTLKVEIKEDIGNLPEGTVKNKKRPTNWSL